METLNEMKKEGTFRFIRGGRVFGRTFNSNEMKSNVYERR